MRHHYYGKKLSRTKNERRRLFSGLVKELLVHGKITTTITKARAVQPMVDKLITQAKKDNSARFGRIDRVLTDRKLTKQLIEESKTRYGNRNSGYTQIIRLGQRRGDATEEVLLQLVDERVHVEVLKPKADKKEKKKVTPKRGRPKKIK